MKKLMTNASIRLFLGFWFIVALFAFGNIVAVKAEDTPSVEGEWEMVSTNAEGWQRDAGAKMKIVRKGNGYEVTSISGDQMVYSGNGTRIVHTYLEDLGGEPGERHGAGSNIPEEINQQVRGQKVPINISYEVSADGNYLTRSQDAKWLYWNTEPAVQFTNYEIKPSFYRVTFKRISGSTQSSSPVSPVVNTAVSGPSPQELLVQQRQKEGHDLNEQAVQCYNNKQWKQAADMFKVAMEKNPDDPTIKTNYEHATAALAAETVAKKQESNNTTPNLKAVENPECTRWSRQDNGCDWRMCPGYCEQCCGNTCTRVKCQ